MYQPTIVSRNAIFTSAGNSRISIVDVRDIAAVAAVALTEAGHEGKNYVITGPEALTHTEIAAHFSEALGKQVRYVDVPYSVSRDALRQMGGPMWQVEGGIELNEMYKRGEAAGVTDTIVPLRKESQSHSPSLHATSRTCSLAQLAQQEGEGRACRVLITTNPK